MNRLIDLRRQFHRCPEPGWCEFQTTALIIKELTALGLSPRFGSQIHAPSQMHGLPAPALQEHFYQEALAQMPDNPFLPAMKGGFTGCVAEIRGMLPGPVTALRFDIDCCEVAECTDAGHAPAALGYASQNAGYMHACGHDGHIAVGLEVAAQLMNLRSQLPGTVRLIFQSAEEGLRGAASMSAAGVLEGVERFFAFHLGIQDLPTGTVAASCTNFLSSTKLDIRFQGLAAHAGLCPEQGRNALAAGAAATLGLLDIPSHHKGLCRVNVGTFHAGSGRNVIPAQAHLTTETRGGTPQINEAAQEELMALCRAAAAQYGCTVAFQFMGAAQAADCDQALVRRSMATISEVPGVTQLLSSIPFGAGEDATTMMRTVQAQGGQATYLLFPTPLEHPHHSECFDFDEAVLPLAVQTLTALALHP